MKMRMRAVPFAALWAVFLAASPSAARAQDQTVDRIAAIAGDSVVLLSELLQREAELAQRIGSLPEAGSAEREELRREILDELIGNQLILQAAIADTTLSLDDQLVDERVAEFMAQTERNFGGRQAMEEGLRREGVTMQAFRDLRGSQLRSMMLIQQYAARFGGQGAVEVSEEELKELYDRERGSLGERPATVLFRQAVISVEPSEAARAGARALIDSLLLEARGGADFAQLARAHSQDPGSATQGGDLGWFRRGRMTKEFEDVAFLLTEDQLSNVVETQFGFHIIRVEQIRFAERRARHILIRPPLIASDRERARERAEEMARRARAGEDFSQLALEFHEAEFAPDSMEGLLERQPGQAGPPPYYGILSEGELGEVVGPIAFEYFGDHFAVLQPLARREAGTPTFEDVKELLRQRIVEEKRLGRMVEELRRKSHVEVLLR